MTTARSCWRSRTARSAAGTVTDLGDEAYQSSTFRFGEDGEIETRTITFDTGLVQDFRFDDTGAVTQKTWTDAANLFGYATIEQTFDTEGRLDTSLRTYDDGDRLFREFDDDGVLRRAVAGGRQRDPRLEPAHHDLRRDRQRDRAGLHRRRYDALKALPGSPVDRALSSSRCALAPLRQACGATTDPGSLFASSENAIVSP